MFWTDSRITKLKEKNRSLEVSLAKKTAFVADLLDMNAETLSNNRELLTQNQELIDWQKERIALSI